MKTITVGHTNASPSAADIITHQNAGIQQAIDELAEQGGGTVRVLPGIYKLRNAVRLTPNITLRGTPGETIFQRETLAVSKLTCDADRGQRVIYCHDARKRFVPGMGIGLFDRASQWTKTSTPYKVTAVHDDHIEIDRVLEEERYEQNDGAVVNYFPMIQAVEADHSIIEGIVCDGTSRIEHTLSNDIEREIAEAFHRPPPCPYERIAAPRTALVFWQHSRHCQVRQMRAYHGAGDGFCFGLASEHMVMEDCEADHNGYYGIHPGSHSAFAKVTHCHIHHNASDGLYVCWGIHHSEFTQNNIHDNGFVQWRSGLSIGHKDSDNLIAENRIANNAKYGICIRNKTPQNAPHRCRYINNTLENNASPPNVLKAVKDSLPSDENIATQVYVGANVTELDFRNNLMRETRPEMLNNAMAFHLHASAKNICIEQNQLDGVTLLADSVCS